MRHRNKVKQLSRKRDHRKALLRNLAIALIQHKRIITTHAKAKVLQRFIEPLITRARKDTMHNRRVIYSRLGHNKHAVKELFATIVPRVMERPGGYTRVLKLGPRKGDAAEMAFIELVDFNEFLNGEKLANESRARRSKSRRRRKKSKKTTQPVAEITVEQTPEGDQTAQEQGEESKKDG